MTTKLAQSDSHLSNPTNDKVEINNEIFLVNVEKNLIYDTTKRILDIILSIIALVLLFPLLLTVAIIIKFNEPSGSIFFTQERVGKDEKTFKMYKFRSMRMDAEDILQELLIKNEVSGAMFKLKNDPRLTRIGKIIRKYSIDELPQLLNVLKGEMSLVGPRPTLPREVLFYTSRDKMRFYVKPGCTGLWQATVRNSVGFEEMVNLDLKYINERTFLFDIKIILLTFKAVFKSNGY